MAKRPDFRPDKPSTSIFSHLILTKNQQKNLLKWVLYGVLLVLISVSQDVLLSKMRIFGAATELVPCAIFLICLLEGTHNGSVFALVAALLYLLSGTAPGPYSMVAITSYAVGACILRQAYLQESFSSAFLCTALAMVLYVLTNFAFGWILGLTPFLRIFGFCVTALISLPAVPLLYPLLKAIGKFGGYSWKE